MKLLQKIGKLSDCTSNTIIGKNLTTKQECIHINSFNSSNIKNLNYTVGDDKNIYFGNIGYYNNSGYVVLVPLYDPNLYYNQINNLKYTKWVSADLVFFQAKLFYYNTNMNALISIKINFEKMDYNFRPALTYNIISKENIVSSLTITTLIFTILNFLTIFYMQVRTPKSRKEKKEELDKRYEKYFTKNRSEKVQKENFLFFKKLNASVRSFFEYYFIAPSILIGVSFINSILAFIFLGLIYSLQYQLTSLEINESLFTDLDYLMQKLDTSVSLGCIVILLFSFDIFKIINHFELVQTKLIFETLGEFLYESLGFSLLLLIPFFFFATVYTYFIYGDYIPTEYSFFSFHFVKSITSFFRGNIDNIDFDKARNRNSYSTTGIIFDTDLHYKR